MSEDNNKTDNFLDKFQALPEVAQGYFLDEKNVDKLIKLGKDFKLSPEQNSTLIDLIGDISVKTIAVKDIQSELEKQLALSSEVAKKLALEVLGNYFLPLNEFYDNEVERTIKEMGGKIKDYPEMRVMIKKESAESAAAEVAKEFLPLFPEEVLRRRFIELLDSRLREVRKESDLREILTRSPKVGGLGLNEETAEKIVAATSEKMRSVKIVSEAEAPQSPPLTVRGAGGVKKDKDNPLNPPYIKGEEAVPKPEPLKPPPIVKVEPISPPIEKKSEEKIPPLMVRGAGGVKQQDTTPPHPPLVRGGDEVAHLAKGGSGGDLKNPWESAKNPRESKSAVVSSESLLKPKQSKDISDAELDREVQHIKRDIMPKAELLSINFQSLAEEIIAESKVGLAGGEQKARLATILVARLKDIRDGNETKEILTRDYALGGMGLAEAAIKNISPILEGEFKKIEERLQAEAEGKIAAARRDEEERRKKSREAAKISEQKNLDSRFGQIVAEKSKKSPAPQKTAASGEPIIPSPPQTGRPKVQDIKYEPMLTGPVDEIGRLTLTDFRRLGKTAKEAAAKIKDKIESLKTDSIRKWQEGVSAWKGSEVNNLYLKIFFEALQSKKSLYLAAADRIQKGEPSLKEEELNAIMELNKTLRF